MKIYVTHSMLFDFANELYQPLRQSRLNTQHEIALPHEGEGANGSHTQFNSKEFLQDCQLVIAEVSYPSTGEGIELGWADMYHVPIICVYKKGTTPARSLKVVSSVFLEYDDKGDLGRKVEEWVGKMR